MTSKARPSLKKGTALLDALPDAVKLRPRHVPTVREFLRDFLIERAVVQPGRGPVEQRVQIEFKPHPLLAA